MEIIVEREKPLPQPPSTITAIMLRLTLPEAEALGALCERERNESDQARIRQRIYRKVWEALRS